MKVAKRCFSLFLVLVMMFSYVGELAGVTTVAHAEEAITSLGTKEVSQTPEELMRFGEWYYWFEDDGSATVAGYANTSESGIEIPARLGGHPVTGIGHRAFSNMTGLKEVQIPTNITHIADDAFKGLSKLTVRAYHGAYALYYAEEAGFKVSCIESMPGVEYAEGVIDLAGLPKYSYRDVTEQSAVFKAGEASFLAVGQVLMFPVSADFPNGLARRVDNIAISGTDLVATFSEPDWTAAFQHAYGEQDLILDWEHAVVKDCKDPDLMEAVISSGALEYLGLAGDYSVQEILDIPADDSSSGLSINVGEVIDTDGLTLVDEALAMEENGDNEVSIESDASAEVTDATQPVSEMAETGYPEKPGDSPAYEAANI